MTRSIRLVVAASSPVLSVDDETKMNAEKHERSLLKVVSDVGSTPTASTISKLFSVKPDEPRTPSLPAHSLAQATSSNRFPDLRLMVLPEDDFLLRTQARRDKQPCVTEPRWLAITPTNDAGQSHPLELLGSLVLAVPRGTPMAPATAIGTPRTCRNRH